MGKLIDKLQKYGWEINQLTFDEPLIYARREFAAWYFYITKDQWILAENIQDRVGDKSIPMLFILVRPDKEVESSVMQVLNKDYGWIPEPNGRGIRFMVVPESWV